MEFEICLNGIPNLLADTLFFAAFSTWAFESLEAALPPLAGPPIFIHDTVRRDSELYLLKSLAKIWFLIRI